MSDEEHKIKKNDPHNPKKLLDRKRDNKGDGYNQEGSNWVPTKWNDTGAGKGDQQRPLTSPKEVYDLNWDLAFGNITKEEHEQKLKELGY
jgi:hypothetical protein